MMIKQLAKIRDKHCDRCRLHVDADRVCVMAEGNKDADILVVGRMPNSATYQRKLEADLDEAGLDVSRMAFTSATKCMNFETSAGKGDIKTCRGYLEEELNLIKPKWVLTLGNEALSALTNRSGIMKHRGRVIAGEGYSVFPTISPSAVNRNPGQRAGYMADLKLFAAELSGKASKIPPPKMMMVDTPAKLNRLVRLLESADLMSFDVETYSDPPGSEWVDSAEILCLCATLVLKEGSVVTWALPLAHPESPFRKIWQEVLRRIAKALVGVRRLIAQNGKYDCRWLRQFGVEGIDLTYDTMLAFHLLDENVPKGLKPQASMRLGVKPWAIDTKDLRTTPMKEMLIYCCLDSFYTYHLYLDSKKELAEQLRLARLFRFILMPANNILIDVERIGVWVDRERLQSAIKISYDMRAKIDAELRAMVPDVESTKKWPRMAKGQGKLAEVNWNPSIFSRWFLFKHMKLPILMRGKTKDDGSPGDPSMKEAVLLELRKDYPVAQTMLDRAQWQKTCTFVDSYGDLLDENDRIHTTFKLYGTVTGRLSSGKAEADKITARAPIRGVNLQQVPRDPFIRSLFGSAPGYTFVEADFSQVELRVVAFLSRDRTMIQLYQTGQDIHAATAAWVLGIPASQVSKDDRKKAKAVNFGFVYGMYPKKFVATAFEKYDMIFSLDEATEIRKLFFAQFKGLLPWHARQRRLVTQYRRVQSPLGRIRHLPDIDSSDEGVRREAERQAVNAPVQSFASDMTMLSMVEIDRKFKAKNIRGRFISTVHDALLFEIEDDHVARALPVIKRTMENLPLEKYFGVTVDIPIVSDIKVGRNWGEARELTEEEVRDYRP